MKKYYLKFGAGDPRTFSGMNCTFLIFESAGATLSPPSIAEDLTGSGIYSFSWGTTTSIAFLADAATTSPGTALRYITGSLDPSDRADEYGNTLVAIGTTQIGQGVSIAAQGVSILAQGSSILAIGVSIYAIGVSIYAYSTSLAFSAGGATSLIGDSSTMPTTLFGYLRRVDALLEGQQQFTKGNPATQVQYDWTGATTISSRSITNNVTLVTKV